MSVDPMEIERDEEWETEKLMLAARMDRAIRDRKEEGEPRKEDIEWINEWVLEETEHPAYAAREGFEPEVPIGETVALYKDNNLELPVPEVLDYYNKAVPEEHRLEYSGGLPKVPTSSDTLILLLNIRELESIGHPSSAPGNIDRLIDQAEREGLEDGEKASRLLNFATVSEAEPEYRQEQHASRLTMSVPEEALAVYEAGRKLGDDGLKRAARDWTEKFVELAYPEEGQNDMEEDLQEVEDSVHGPEERTVPEIGYFSAEAQGIFEQMERYRKA
ncbi:MAG: hypothetical protein ABEJ03_06065, partial [Candidatus Nanohaloarchaea archaeon]